MSELKLDAGFKKPEISSLPDGWKVKRLEDFSKFFQGGKLGLTKEYDYVSSGVPAFSAAGQDGYVEKCEFKSRDAVILSAIGATCGRCFYASGDWTTLANVQAIVPESDVMAKYLFFRVGIEGYWTRSGSAQPFIKPSSAKKSWVAFPADTSVQGKIVEVLNTIDEAIEQTESLFEKYSLVKAGMMHDLFSRGLTPDGKLRPSREESPDLYKETPIGWIPKEWDLKPLGSMSKIASGITLNSKSEPAQSVSVPYLRVANVQDGYLDLAEMKEIRVSKEAVARYALQEGDVLMNEGGDFDKLGRGTVWPGDIDPCIHQNHVFRVRTEKQILRPYFLTYWSQSNHGKKYFLLSSKQSTNLASINSKQLNAYPIGVPTTEEQSEIEIRITSVNSKLETLEHGKHKLLVQKSGLMHDLLTGEVPVNVAEPEATHV